MGLRFKVDLPGPFSYSTRIGGKRKRRTGSKRTRRSPSPPAHSQACRNGDSTSCRRCRQEAHSRRTTRGWLVAVAVLVALGLAITYWRIVLPILVTIGALAAYRPLARWFQKRAEAHAPAAHPSPASAQHSEHPTAAEPTPPHAANAGPSTSGLEHDQAVPSAGFPPLQLRHQQLPSGQWVLQLHDGTTGQLLAHSDRRLAESGIHVAELRGERNHPHGCTAGDFAPGSPVTLLRDTDNPYDHNAIAVYDATTHHQAGYVHKNKAPHLAGPLDRGEPLDAIAIHGTGPTTPCSHITILTTSPAMLTHLNRTTTQ